MKKWVSGMHDKTNHFGWFEDIYSCECHGPECFACRYQVQQRKLNAMTERRRKLLTDIRIMDTRFVDTVLANVVKDKLSITDKPGVISHTAECAVQGLLEDKKERLRTLQQQATERMLGKLRMVDVKPTSTSGCASKAREVAKGRQTPMCRSKNHPSKGTTRILSMCYGLDPREAKEAWAEYKKISDSCAEYGEDKNSDRWIEGELWLLDETCANACLRSLARGSCR